VAVYYKSINYNPIITPLLLIGFFTAMCYGFAVQLVSTVDQILTDIARRRVSVGYRTIFAINIDYICANTGSLIRADVTKSTVIKWTSIYWN